MKNNLVKCINLLSKTYIINSDIEEMWVCKRGFIGYKLGD